MVFSVSFQQRGFLLEGLSLIAFAKYASTPLGFSKDRILILSGAYILAYHLERHIQTYLKKSFVKPELPPKSTVQSPKTHALRQFVKKESRSGLLFILQALPFVATYLALSYLTKKPFQFETVFKLGLLIGGQEVAKAVAGVVNRMLTHPMQNIYEDSTILQQRVSSNVYQP
ncbi:MAG: hypothetical protein K940chlam8_00957 [Chlamydiae bacterium]|nr:hypothetical protein [Chlamydiota bacterium]